jgi:uncharacterized BrkB/YihY/UPF0761 family membrane protein
MKGIEKIPFLKKIVDIGYALLIVILISAIIGLIMAFPVMWLWNFVFSKFPSLHINVFQAWALNMLVSILFSKGSSERK